MLALSSTDAWMERVIQKKEKKGKAAETAAQDSSDNTSDPFEEYNQYIKQPRLNRDDCPNPISWWGVSNGLFITVGITLTLSFSISLNSLFSA